MSLPAFKTTDVELNIMLGFIQRNMQAEKSVTHVANMQLAHLIEDFRTALRIIATHDLCHDLHGKVGPCEFAKGCEREQRSHFGQAPHADRIADIRKKLEGIIETEGCDAGVIYLSNDGPCHTEIIDGKEVSVYNHEYFSPLGDALMEIYKMTEPL